MEGPLVWGRQEEVDGWRKGPWTSQEDKLLVDHVRQHGEGRWNSVSKLAGAVSVQYCLLLIVVIFIFLPRQVRSSSFHQTAGLLHNLQIIESASCTAVNLTMVYGVHLL